MDTSQQIDGRPKVKQLDKRPKILCIDDDPAIATAIAIRLRPYNVDVVSAFFGAQGIWLAVTEEPDVIITDMRMPQGEGRHVVECLQERADTCDIPVIVLTGIRDVNIELRMRALGVKWYFHKPLHFDTLRDALTKIIDLQPAPSPSPA
jgi:DNA-binding response OmpR family regulator